MFGRKKVRDRMHSFAKPSPTYKGNLARVDFFQMLTNPAAQRAEVAQENIAENEGAQEEKPLFVSAPVLDLPPIVQEQLEPGNTSIADILDEGIDALREGLFERAGSAFQKVVFMDLEHEYAQGMLKMTDYWVEKSKRYNFLSQIDRVDFLLESWKNFCDVVLSRLEFTPDRALFAIRGWLFGQMAYYIELQLKEKESAQLYLKLGRAYKMRGDYDLAIEAYSEGVGINRTDAVLLAELADCYAIVDEEANARLFLREALFHGAMEIDFDYLESAMIVNLQKKVKEIRPEDKYSPEWLGVYGVLWGLLSIGRELKPAEYARLNQSIHMLRSEIEDIPVRREVLVPRLIYRLFWLIDYYKNLSCETEDAKTRIRSALLDIRFLDERIAKEYRL
ncbi:MAG: tetratricopeptide repeat protein [Spirochaetia bacterium]